jgi:protein-glutamine gamma-glutamyltransferase
MSGAARWRLVPLLLLQGAIYALCQRDPLLPALAGCVLLVGLAMGRGARGGLLPLWLVLVLCGIAGGLWRALASPAPPEAFSVLPLLVDAAQAGALLAGAAAVLALWPAELVRLLAWVGVALSMNVPPRFEVLVLLGAFFALNALGWVAAAWGVLGLTRRTGRAGAGAFALPVAFVALAGAGAVLLSGGVEALDRVLAEAIAEAYEQPALSPTLQPVLRLGGSGPAGRSLKPVLEVVGIDGSDAYLRWKIFERYSKGRWLGGPEQRLRPLPERGGPDWTQLELTLFVPLGDVAPAPAGVAAAARGARSDDDGIVYVPGAAYPRSARLFVAGHLPAAVPDEAALARLSEVPEAVREDFERLAAELAAAAGSDREAAELFVAYLRGFDYSLDVALPTGDAALLSFLAERRPAYCTYFAAALALLLRTRGVPARVVSGFRAREAEAGGSRLVVRLRDAHAWVEAWLQPAGDADGPRSWVTLDGTPAAAAVVVSGRPEGLKGLLDRVQRALQRTWAGRSSASVLGLLRAVVYPWALLGVLAFILGRELARQWSSRSRGAAEVDSRLAAHPLHGLYSRWQASLERLLEAPRPPAETDRELLERLQARAGVRPRDLERAERFLRGYRAARYGGASSDSEELEPLVRELEEAKLGPGAEALSGP